MPNDSIGFGEDALPEAKEVVLDLMIFDCAAVKEFSFSTRTVHCEHPISDTVEFIT